MKRLIGVVFTLVISSLLFANVLQAKSGDMIGTVVSVSVYDAYNENGKPQYVPIQSGSGVLLDEYGTIATNAHVVDVLPEEYVLKGKAFIAVCIGKAIFVENKCNYIAKETKRYDEIDLAFLEVNGILFPGDNVEFIEPYEFKFLNHNYVEISETEPKVNDEVTIIGYPFYTDEYNPEYDFGEIIEKPDFDISEYGRIDDYYFTNAFIVSGNSGGGAFNSNDEFIGMPTFVYDGYAGLLKAEKIYEYYESDIINNIDKTSGDTQSIATIRNDIINETPFRDVGIFHPYYGMLYELNFKGIVNGYDDGTFKPYGSINRAEFAKLTYPLLNDVYKNNEKNCFPDVKEEWFADAVCSLKQAGVLSGYADGYFRPADNINFAEASKILSLLYKRDLSEPSVWYENYVRYLEQEKAIPYSISDFGQQLTRGEVATMITHLYYIDDLPSEMKYEDVSIDRDIRIIKFIDKIDRFVELTENYENIGFVSKSNNYYKGDLSYTCDRTFYMPEFNVYGEDAKSVATLECEDISSGQENYKYTLTRNGYKMQYLGENQPIFEPSFWKLGIDAKAYRVIENMIYYPELIHDIERKGDTYKVKIDPMLGVATRYENYHTSSVSGAKDFYYFRLNNRPTSYDIEFEFDEIGHLLSFHFIETTGDHVFERDVLVDYSATGIDYELKE